MSKVFNIYFNFGESGNYYLERMLINLNLNPFTFHLFPPYFIVGLENEHIKK